DETLAYGSGHSQLGILHQDILHELARHSFPLCVPVQGWYVFLRRGAAAYHLSFVSCRKCPFRLLLDDGQV
mgnify:CR=1